MAEHTSSRITIEAAPAEVMGVIADFARYPDWTGEVKEADILATDEQGRAEQVRLVMDAGAIKDDQTLAYTWAGADEVSWTLVKSQMLRSLDGSYRLRAVTGGTEVTYQLTVDVKIPMLGMIKRKAEKVITDRALAGLKKRVEAGPPAAGTEDPAKADPAGSDLAKGDPAGSDPAKGDPAKGGPATGESA